MNKLRQDLDNLLATIEEYVVNQGRDYYKSALQYRLSIIEEKFERSVPAFTSGSYEKMKSDIVFARAILS